jgi:hypothetical protein
VAAVEAVEAAEAVEEAPPTAGVGKAATPEPFGAMLPICAANAFRAPPRSPYDAAADGADDFVLATLAAEPSADELVGVLCGPADCAAASAWYKAAANCETRLDVPPDAAAPLPVALPLALLAALPAALLEAPAPAPVGLLAVAEESLLLCELKLLSKVCSAASNGLVLLAELLELAEESLDPLEDDAL